MLDLSAIWCHSVLCSPRQGGPLLESLLLMGLSFLLKDFGCSSFLEFLFYFYLLSSEMTYLQTMMAASSSLTGLYVTDSGGIICRNMVTSVLAVGCWTISSLLVNRTHCDWNHLKLFVPERCGHPCFWEGSQSQQGSRCLVLMDHWAGYTHNMFPLRSTLTLIDLAGASRFELTAVSQVHFEHWEWSKAITHTSPLMLCSQCGRSQDVARCSLFELLARKLILTPRMLGEPKGSVSFRRATRDQRLAPQTFSKC